MRMEYTARVLISRVDWILNNFGMKQKRNQTYDLAQSCNIFRLFVDNHIEIGMHINKLMEIMRILNDISKLNWVSRIKLDPEHIIR